jgi:hypothetical protein
MIDHVLATAQCHSDDWIARPLHGRTSRTRSGMAKTVLKANVSASQNKGRIITTLTGIYA